MAYKLEEAAYYRKALSTCVETALEATTKKYFTHFGNNVFATIRHIKNRDKVINESVYVASQNGLIEKIISEMRDWYTSDNKDAGYDPKIVAIVLDHIPPIFDAVVYDLTEMGRKIDEYVNPIDKEA